MRRFRWKRYAFMMIVLLLATGGAGVVWLTKDPVDPLALADRHIHIGMSLHEAVALIGRPRDSGGFQWSAPDWAGHDFHEWFGRGSDTIISKLQLRSIDDRVISTQFTNYRPSVWEKCHRWLKSVAE